MAFEEMSSPPTLPGPKKVYATFDQASSPAGLTTSHHPSASLLKDTPPSVVVALSQLGPIISVLDTALALITWTGHDMWSSFLLLASWWLLALYGDIALYWGGNWLVLLLLGLGYLRKRNKLRVKTSSVEDLVHDTSTQLRATLYEIECLQSRCHLLMKTVQPIVDVIRWKDPQQSTLIGLRLVLCTPLWIVMMYFLTVRVFVLLLGSLLLVCTSPWFKVICTVSWRFQSVRRIISALVGVDYLPGESRFVSVLARQPTVTAVHSSPQGSQFTTTISINENQRRWLGLGWTSSLLPHERAPYTDQDEALCPEPNTYGLPSKKVVLEEGGKQRTISWKWIDSEWRVEKDRGRDAEGWIYSDNSWRQCSDREEYGKYTRRRKWIRNAECHEIVSLIDQPDAQSCSTPVKSSSILVGKSPLSYSQNKQTGAIDPVSLNPASVPLSFNSNTGPSLPTRLPERKEWRTVSGGGKELVVVKEDIGKIKNRRPFLSKSRGSAGSTKSVSSTFSVD